MKYLSLVALLFSLSFNSFSQTIPFAKLNTRGTGIFDAGGTEIVAFDKNNNYVYTTNRSLNRVEVYDYSDVSKPKFLHYLDVSPYVSTITGVDVYLQQVAVVGYNNPQSPGKLMFFDEKGTPTGQFPAGAMPSMVTFSIYGTWVLVANEGEPSDDYTTDPEGSVSMLNISNGVANTSPSSVKFVNFQGLDTTAYDYLIHIYGNNGLQLPSQDLEPEHIAINPASTKAYVTLQENNAVAVIDLATATLDTVLALGYKDFSVTGLDASDTESDIDIKPYNRLFGMYQPDGIASYSANGNIYFATANEGKARDYSAYSELAKVTDFIFDANAFPNYVNIYQDSVLGRLDITNTLGNNDNDLFQDSLFCFGGRSFSIWDENGQLVWDSGDQFEQITAQMFPNEFNSDDDDNNSRKSTSNEKGPEPESIVIGEVDGTPYAFITLKKMGGIMIYDISDPTSPKFEMYELNRDFSKAANSAGAGDLGPSSLEFIPANVSPTGFAMLLVANEVSGTITAYEMGIGIGIEEYYMVEDEAIFPNPSTGIFNTTYEGDYKVYNMDGKLVKSITNHTVIDLKDQPAGIYIIKNTEGQAIKAVKK
ncbi:hypothetical protein Oweho_1551 [Owenweeksia hongkongensis DSM 17368]|uniref:Uncharacterized protein n=1 Tax=Owenweeksia hongkongensis (strain DSM 17368 / CIP 108786 / JCM 12287 / NRRL B-23963 / UST20020801) TaxID=926562 RepID=G8QZB3_OWEHD|nr:choice-of-anchor I family protein [Owenweeksia hongkongensis]AEV32541.1 hypothetical protein Oweho_1551 [Owenweeksia hongkongensis DSM 17368]